MNSSADHLVSPVVSTFMSLNVSAVSVTAIVIVGGVSIVKYCTTTVTTILQSTPTVVQSLLRELPRRGMEESGYAI